MDPKDGLLVCKISGHCFDCMMSPDESEADPVSRNFSAPSFVYLSLRLRQFLSL